MSASQWTAGAHSLEPLEGSGYFRFLVPVGTTGASVGLSAADNRTAPLEPSYGFLFESGRFRIFAGGAHLTEWAPYTSGTAFYIGREYGRPYFGTGPAELSTTDNFLLEGSAATEAKIFGPLFLDAALLMPGDRVDSASMSNGLRPRHSRVDIAFEPMALIALTDVQGVCDIAFEPMQMGAVSDPLASVVISFAPMAVMASETAFCSVDIAFEPMTAQADQWPQSNVVDITMQPMTAQALEHSSMVAIEFEPLQARASEAAAQWNVVLPAFRGGVPPAAGIMLPAFRAVAALSADVDDVALASDAVYLSHYTLVVDGAFASDQLIAGAESVEAVEDTALASAEVVLGASVLLEDVALASDELLPTASTMLVVGTALAGDELLPQSTGSVLVTSGALAGGDALPYVFVDVEGVALASDDALIVSTVMLEDEALAGDETITTSSRAQVLLEDAALAGDELLAWTDSFALLQDVAVANEQLIMKTPGLVAWVMNTDTGAVSWYDNWAFTSMAAVGGKVFAAGPDGLHVIGGDLDGIDQIDARVQFGYTEFGGYDQTGVPKPNEPKKRVQALWFGYHADGVLQATVETYGQGYGPYAYAMAPRAADQPRNNRIVPGKGLNARYWRIGVANTGGCAFEVHSIAAEVAQSTRRL